jgi:hypothetical protein
MFSKQKSVQHLQGSHLQHLQTFFFDFFFAMLKIIKFLISWKNNIFPDFRNDSISELPFT